MHTTGPKCIATYLSPSHAHLAKAVLAADGIRSSVVGDQISTTLGWFGAAVTRVNLLVQEADTVAARHRLNEWEDESSRRKQDRWGIESRQGWRCNSCAEVNEPNFDECWSCTRIRPDDAEPVPLPDDLEANVDPPDLITARVNPDPSPFRVPNIENLPSLPSADAELIDRTFRSAIFGLWFPPLAAYSFGLAWRCLNERHATPTVWAAMFISAATILLWLVYFFLMGLH